MPVGVFDSGYGGLTILTEIKKELPEYDYIYLGDNARAPYGTRSFDVVYDYTLQAVKALFEKGCHLVILACNTASAKALRTIQQRDLPEIDPSRRVLGIIRPTVEYLPGTSESGHIGVLATQGTVASHSYKLELEKLAPSMVITEHACPMWVPLVENNEACSEGADYFVKKEVGALLQSDPLIDTVVLGCTHYPLLTNKIKKYVNEGIKIVSQGKIVAQSLKYYLRRHPEIDVKCEKNGRIEYFTTENPDKFNSVASLFVKNNVNSIHINLPYDCMNPSTQDLDKIREMLPDEAIPLLDKIIGSFPDNDEAYTLRGMKYWALGKRSQAINDYLAALRINPDSKAKMALQTANSILDFYNKDLLNP